MERCITVNPIQDSDSLGTADEVEVGLEARDSQITLT